MYTPRHFEETRPQVLQSLIRQHPLATVVTQVDGELNANHIPLLFSAGPAPHGELQGHVARANPILNDLAHPHDVLMIFQGPNAYISPSWYEEKALTGKVVPTWNYLAVHAYGTVSIHDDPDWLREHLHRLTGEHEGAMAAPWQLEDAPDEYITRMLRGIVGIEFTISRIIGKWKLSQNKSAADQQAIAAGLDARERPDGVALARTMADTAKTTP